MKISVAPFLLLLAFAAAAGQIEGQFRYDPPGRLVDIGGYRLHLNCTGKAGPTVVLIAGAGDFSFDWALVQPGISRFARVCSYDRAGLAWSDPGPTPRTMRQDAYELRALLRAARIEPPYVLVGHSIGGLIARLYALEYPGEVGALVLVDPTHEDTVLLYQGRLARVRESAKGVAVPPPRTLRESPPQPPTKEDLEQFELNQKVFGAPKIEPPFDKLPARAQAMRLWFMSRPPRAAAGPDFWAEELQAMYEARARAPRQLGDTPLFILLPSPEQGDAPQGIAPEEWKRVNEEKRRQKFELTGLSRRSILIVAKRSGHHIQLDEPRAVVTAVRMAVGAARSRAGKSP